MTVPQHIRDRVRAVLRNTEAKKHKDLELLKNTAVVLKKPVGRTVKRHTFEYVPTTVLDRLIATIPEPQLRVAVRVEVEDRIKERKTEPSDEAIEKLFHNSWRRLWIKLHNFQHGRTSRLGLRAQ